MFHLLASLPTEYLIGGAIVTLAAAWILGLVAHLVMRDRGFGVIGNAALLLLGAAAGIYVSGLFSGPFFPL